MISKIFFVILISILCSQNLSAQFAVEFNEVKGTLNSTDKFKSGFGRYDGYEITLYKGEAVNFVVYSDKFQPRLAFVSQKGEVYKQSNGDQNNVASLIASVPEEGEWILYVAGDSTASGSYTFQYAFASANSISLSADADFCSRIKFIAEHAKAYFLLFENSFDSQQPFVKLEGSLDTFLDEDGSYNSVLYEGNNIKEAEKIVRELSNNISKCLGKSWQKKTSQWIGEEDYKVKTELFSVSEEKPREVKVNLLDLKNSRQKFTGDYKVVLTIFRKN
ncbi:MAG: hypothetical protein HYS25_15930 [Ignavibacteriales bacterium]|nr:hypothetical protein [Ignavibacteriales bacterium]